jgi:hypothetical protein
MFTPAAGRHRAKLGCVPERLCCRGDSMSRILLRTAQAEVAFRRSALDEANDRALLRIIRPGSIF